MIDSTDHLTKDIKLTSAEMGNLWITYMDDSMLRCMLKYFLEKVEDKDMKPIFEYALELTEKHIKKITEFFQKDNHVVPKGFTDGDVTITAPRLYSDPFMLIYANLSARYRMTIDALSLGDSSRSDIRKFYSELCSSIDELFQRSTEVLLSKGLYVRPPQMPTQDKVEFIQKESFLNGWIGNRRPSNALEITQYFFNNTRNVVGASLLTGFGQVASSPKVREYIMRGKEMAHEHVQIFSKLLQEGDLPSPTFSDLAVTDSTVSPFSDKLLMFHTTALTQGGIVFYGTGLSRSARRDLAATYIRLIAEVGTYSENGMKIMIENGWFEQPPALPDRKQLVKS